MHIKKETFNYFEGLYRSIEEAKKKFLDSIIKAGSKRIGEEISKIKVVGDDIFDGLLLLNA